MDKEDYKLKDFLFQMRKEYLKMEKKLAELKKYSELKEPYEDLHFCIVNQTVMYDFLCRKPGYFLRNQKELIGSSLYKKGDYFCSDDFLKIIDPIAFKYTVCEILQDEFSKSMNLSSVWDSFNQEKGYLRMSCSGMHIYLEKQLYPKNSIHMRYYSDKDYLNIQQKRNLIKQEEIVNLFETTISRDFLTEYHKRLMENGQIKKIEICPFEGIGKDGTFKFVEESDQIIVKKIKNRSL